MAEHHEAGRMEMVEVKAEDIMAERRSFYNAFMSSTVWAVGSVVVLLVLMAIFLL